MKPRSRSFSKRSRLIQKLWARSLRSRFALEFGDKIGAS